MNLNVDLIVKTTHHKVKSHNFFQWWIVMVISVFILSSCKKEDAEWVTIIEGAFKTARIDEIVPGGPYKISLYSFTTDELIDETYTDSQGRFYFKNIQPDAPHYRLEHRGFYLHAEGDFPEGYGEFRRPYGYSGHLDGLIKAGYQGEVNLWLFKKSWIKIHVVNVNYQPNDELWLQFQNYGVIRLYGNTDTVITENGAAHVHSTVTHMIWRNEQSSGTIIDSVILPPMDTLYYKLEY